jgi:pSer/pThr/pTyr-binding forkhead associated (FHA) protein
VLAGTGQVGADVPGASAAVAVSQRASDTGDPRPEGVFRPVVRPPTPRVTVLDDGDTVQGEIVRLREQATLIGRNEGHIRLPHDPLVSSKHAEIVREGAGQACRWILRDLGSSNGTFVCCSRTVLRPDKLLILGSRRYRFQMPQAGKAAAAGDPGTLMLDTASAAAAAWPMLVETTQPHSQSPIRLTATELSVGQAGSGNHIELVDPLIASCHATIRRTAAGEWWIEAKPSRNGVWVQVGTIALTEMCRFQCGEQRFLFVV